MPGKGGAWFFFSLLGKWASLAAVVVSNLGQASYLGWSNENHQYLDVMLENLSLYGVYCYVRIDIPEIFKHYFNVSGFVLWKEVTSISLSSV